MHVAKLHRGRRPAMKSITARSWTPSSSRTVAAVCRASCSRASRTSASPRTVFHSPQSRWGSIGRPFGCVKIQPPSFHSVPACSRSRCCTFRAASAARTARRAPRTIGGRPSTSRRPRPGLRVPLRAATRVPGAVRRAGAGVPLLIPDAVIRVPVSRAFVGACVPMAFCSAGVRIGTTMLPGLPLYRFRDAVDLAGAVKPFPPEP